MTENRVLRRTFRPTKEEVTGGWRKSHNEELHFIRVAKSRSMRRDEKCIENFGRKPWDTQAQMRG
jgi:hypothetical protein